MGMRVLSRSRRRRDCSEQWTTLKGDSESARPPWWDRQFPIKKINFSRKAPLMLLDH